MIAILRSIFHPLEALILLTALYVSTAIFSDLKPIFISFIGHQEFILTATDILIKLFIGTSVVGFALVLLSLGLYALLKAIALLDKIPILDKVSQFLTDLIDLLSDYRRWGATGSQVLLDSVVWCISFMAIRHYWDVKEVGKAETITFLQYVHNQYGVNAWMMLIAIAITVGIVGNRILNHRFDSDD